MEPERQAVWCTAALFGRRQTVGAQKIRFRGARSSAMNDFLHRPPVHYIKVYW